MPIQPLVFRSRQKLTPGIILVLAAAGLGYMTYAAMDPSFEITGRGAGLFQAIGREGMLAFFGICAAICAACVGLVLYRRLLPKDELILTQDSVTSNLFWGKGTLTWASVTKLMRQKNFLFIHGVDANGKTRKLTADLDGLSAPGREILAAIEARRPDLFS